MTVRKMRRVTCVLAVPALVGVTTNAWGLVLGGGLPVGGELRGVTQIKGSVVCVGCSMDEVRETQPNLTHLYELRHEQGQVVMKVDAVSERARWESIVGLSHQLSVRAPAPLFQRLAAEENLFKEVEITGLLSSTRTLDIGDVRIPGPSIAERVRVAGERAKAAAIQAEAAATRAERAVDQAERIAARVERTIQRVEAMTTKVTAREE